MQWFNYQIYRPYRPIKESAKSADTGKIHDMIEIPSAPDAHCSTLEVARQLGMAVRSVQLMVDRGELEARKTPGATVAFCVCRSNAGWPSAMG